MNYTQEQLNFINSKEKRITLESIAGSGKSTSIIGKVNSNPDKNTLILTFSKKLESDLNQRLNNFNTKICTLHSLAYNAMNIGYGTVSAGMLFLSQFVPSRKDFMFIIATPYLVESGKSLIESLQDPTSKAYKINQLMDKGLDKALIELDKTISDKTIGTK